MICDQSDPQCDWGITEICLWSLDHMTKKGLLCNVVVGVVDVVIVVVVAVQQNIDMLQFQ